MGVGEKGLGMQGSCGNVETVQEIGTGQRRPGNRAGLEWELVLEAHP